jgi:hypothetical protein
MLLMNALRRFSDWRACRRADAFASKVVARSRATWGKVSGGLWIMDSKPEHGFQVQTRIMPDAGYLSIVASANFHIEPEFVSREVLWFLLELNSRLTFGSFAVCVTAKGFEIVHGHQCAIDRQSPAQIAAVASQITRQMHDAIRAMWLKDLL